MYDNIDTSYIIDFFFFFILYQLELSLDLLDNKLSVNFAMIFLMILL